MHLREERVLTVSPMLLGLRDSYHNVKAGVMPRQLRLPNSEVIAHGGQCSAVASYQVSYVPVEEHPCDLTRLVAAAPIAQSSISTCGWRVYVQDPRL